MSADEILDKWYRRIFEIDACADDAITEEACEIATKLISGYRELNKLKYKQRPNTIGDSMFDHLERKGWNDAIEVLRQIIDKALGVSG